MRAEAAPPSPAGMVSGCFLCPSSSRRHGLALSHGQLMARTRSLPADEPPALSASAGAHHADVVQRLSAICAPVLVPRGQTATVNTAYADRSNSTPASAFRRRDSLGSQQGTLAGQSLTPGNRLDSCGTPSVHGAAPSGLV